MSPSPSSKASLRWRRAGLPGVLVALVLLLALIIRPASPTVFAAMDYPNPDGIDFPEEGVSGPANPYPSTITVAGLVGSIVEVKVHITGLSHTFPSTIDMLLVGPNGGQVLLMSDAGGFSPINGVNLIFQDGANALPASAQIVSGTYRPTNHFDFGDDIFPPAVAPLPSPPGLLDPPNLSLATAFQAADPNGAWQLYVVKDDEAGLGTIDSWSLEIATVDLAVVMGDEPETVLAGEPLSYTVSASNKGTEDVANAEVRIAIPTGTTFDSIVGPIPMGWTCPAPGPRATTIVCATTTMASGAAVEFAVELVVNPALAEGTVLTRSAVISSDVAEGPSAIANNSDALTTTVVTQADVGVSVLDSTPDPVNAGAELTTIFGVANYGPSNALSVTVTLPVPDATTFVSLTAPAAWTCVSPAVGATGTSTCTRPVLAPINLSAMAVLPTDIFTTVVKLNADLLDEETIVSTGEVASATTDPAPTNNKAERSVTVATEADLVVTVTDSPDPVSTAANLTYTMVVTNNGPSHAAAVTLTTTIEPGTLFQSLVAPAGWMCTTPAVNRTGPLTCTHPSFGVTSATFPLVVRVVPGVPTGTFLPFAVEVATETLESNGLNNSSAAATEVTSEADTSLAIAGPAQVKAGSIVTYTFSLNNAGPEFAANAVFTTTVPANTTFVGLSTPQTTPRWTCTSPDPAGQIVCRRSSFAVGTQDLALTVQLGAAIDFGTQITLTGQFAVALPEDPNLANNTATFVSTVDNVADLSLAVAGTTTPVNAGTIMTYTMTLVNGGPEDASNVRFTSAVPTNTTFVALPTPAGWTCTTPAAGGTGAISCTGPSLAVNGNAVFTLSLQAGTVAVDTPFTLTATAAADQRDPVAGNNTASTTRTILAPVDPEPEPFVVYLPIIAKN